MREIELRDRSAGVVSRHHDDLATGKGTWTDRPVLDEYRAMLIERCRTPKGMRVVMDCGNGCAGTVVPQAFERMGHTALLLTAPSPARHGKGRGGKGHVGDKAF